MRNNYDVILQSHTIFITTVLSRMSDPVHGRWASGHGFTPESVSDLFVRKRSAHVLLNSDF